MRTNFLSEFFEKTCLTPAHISVGITIFLFSFSMVFISRYSRLNNTAAIRTDSTRVVYLYHDSNIHQLNKILTKNEIQHDSLNLFWASHLLGWRKFKQGRYVINHDYSYNSFLKRLAMGIQSPIRVTILPGQTKKHFVKEVAGHFLFSADSLEKTMADSSVLASLGANKKDIYGRMLPDTYLFYWNMSPKEFLGKMLHEFHRLVVDKYKDRFTKLNKSVDQILTLASIVEWEAKVDSEKPVISGLYWNRLKKGWPLQADPTINYIIGERRRLLYKDYRIKSPYNTYINKGLPPGPITNPSLSSIKAALYPDSNDYMYMVAQPNGEHAFARTLAKHKRQSERWRRWLRKQYRIKRERERAAADSLKAK